METIKNYILEQTRIFLLNVLQNYKQNRKNILYLYMFI